MTYVSVATCVICDAAASKLCSPDVCGAMQDFYNLVDVYLDAVLHPKCLEDEKTFAQEGWHYELDDPSVSQYFHLSLPPNHHFTARHPAFI